MGYTTSFDGRLTFSRPLTVPEFNELKGYSIFDRPTQDGEPDTYCQWEPTKDGLGLEWDGGEKFYCYVEWLEYLIENWFKPRSITLNGVLRYQGEEIGDVGRIEVEDNQVKKVELEPDGIVECPSCGERFKPNE